MYITITVTTPTESNDIQIDHRQRISAAGEMLISTKKSASPPTPFYRSRMQKRLVSSYNTFLDEEIWTGDELIAISPKEEAQVDV